MQFDKLQLKKSSHFLIIGFSIILFLLVVVAFNSLIYLNQLNNDLETIVSVNNVKTDLLQDMKDAMRLRQLSMRDMMLYDDAFDVDEAWVRHRDAASRFMVARDNLTELGMPEDETTIYNNLLDLTSKGGVHQQEMVQMVLAGKSNIEIDKVFARALQTQGYAFTEMEKLTQLQQANAQITLLNAKKDYKIIASTTLVLGVFALSTGAIVATLVLRRNRLQMQLINEYQAHLEVLVDKRTRELTAINEELEQFNYSLAHDLRTPLRSIVSYSQIISSDAKYRLDAEDLVHFERIINAGKKMAQLIDDIGLLSKINRKQLNPEKVNLSELGRKIIDELKSQDHEKRNVEFNSEENLVVETDKPLIQLLLQNLLANAWKYTKGINNAKIQLGRNRVNGHDIYYVKDNGVGFNMQYSGKVFGQFQQLNNAEDFSSTGIGLAIVERAIKRHNGRVWAQSEPGKGATFYFQLNTPEAENKETSKDE